MDKILEAILMSSYPDHVKHGLVRRVIEASKQSMDSEQCWSMLELSTKLFLVGDTKFKRSVGKDVLEAYGLYHREVFEEFFNVRFLLSLLQEGYGPLGKRSLYVLDYIYLGLPFVLDSSSANDIFSLLRTEVLRKVCERPGLKQCVKISKLLTQYPQCIPTGKRQALFCQQLIRCIGQFCTSSGREEAIVDYLDHVTKVGLLLQKIWKAQVNSILPSLKELFSIISATEEQEPPSIALASVVQYVPLELMDGILRNLTNDDSITDVQMMVAIGRMIEWVSWPLGKNIDKWVIALLKGLAAVKKFSILIEVTLSKIERVFSKLLYPILREGALSILRYMLLSFQHSHEAFHLLLPHIPRMVASLNKENSNSAASCREQLAELIHCMFFRFSGFPDLYEPVVEAIKALPIPNEDRIKHLLGQNAWTSQKNELASFYPRLASKSETGKIGLINLGNTCYMNSIIQALFMASDFRHSVMNLAESNSQPLMAKLQWLFAFLEHSQRPAISPESFFSASWPPWFARGAQQDCSEYLKYLLDRLHEEERTGRRIYQKLKESTVVSQPGQRHSPNKTLVEKMFGGKITTKIRCLKCLKVSSKEEAFTDLSLAFPPADKHTPIPSSSSTSVLPVEELGPQSIQPSIDMQSQVSDLSRRSGKSNISGENPSKILPVETLRPEEQESFPPLRPKQDSMKPDEESSLVLQEQVRGAEASRSVPDLINYFLSPEMLTAENRYHCENCASLQDAEKLAELTEGPHYLILTLLRFSFDLQAMRRKKILDNVSVPLVLKLPVLMSSKELSKASPGKNTECASSHNSFSSVVYDLCSVVVHSGVSSESGHYYCYARECEDATSGSDQKDVSWKTPMEKPLDVAVQWYLFNDTRVSFSSFESVSNVTSFLPKDTAYLLFYRQRMTKPRSVGQEAAAESGWVNGELHSPDKSLMEAIAKDNILYLQEQEKEARSRSAYISAVPKSPLWWKDFDRDDEDDSSSGGCGHAPGGGGSGSFHGLVF
ncbi:ubiquitin carboxyl-terminal hydrolase 35 [Hemicordylus capensis]|uniref:ubiquitin carboxyl-terminal hydrolase 35 n=1 Tax=Hemicordylus capensis TaxID=884348 RepID=UPI002304A166|nr:ubiquitin carboxyl-terminal hydrolase 35 [Hemicordylus capensis]XP_053167514.1 ubiquitin carboxyl-terminal hydrolase 35 [Hemicordylus capensis]XP_053167515.1 ubiquitin carboxyl-terminal hydrolase 35 [Hemicordylus capensis]XP_053167516.1 ubiquitin carboxyl-terminal hydrolase 35 [Hemicordylus capensis]XP_053167517.1 ubiquitin carboxyl-terminal hydrolase 35 [Hemicordylus capensis]